MTKGYRHSLNRVPIDWGAEAYPRSTIVTSMTLANYEGGGGGGRQGDVITNTHSNLLIEYVIKCNFYDVSY